MLLVAGCGAPSAAVIADLSVGGGDGDVDMALPNAGDFATTPSTLMVVPLSASLAFGQSQPFSANRAVTWSIAEAVGGQIAADGRYTAPSLAGVFHVHAVAADGSGDEVFATVTVSEHALTFVAGSYGGLGDADGVGTAARFSSAHGLAYDGARFVYIGDAGAVRRLDLTTNQVFTVAGRARWWTGNVDDVGAAAKFGTAYSVALDGKGGLYVSDFTNNTIRRIDLASRKVTTVAGQAGVAGFANDKGTAALFSATTGLAFDAARQILYIGDNHNAAIRTYDPATTQVSTLTNQLMQPDGLAYDGNGKLYVVDANAVFTVATADGTVTRLAGSGRGVRDGMGLQAHFEAPSSLALEGGALYVGDTLALRKIDLASATVTSQPLRDGFAGMLNGVVGDGQGHLFVTSGSDFSIRRVDPASGTDAIVAGPDGSGTGNVDGVGEAARFSNPGHVAAGPSGAVYVSDSTNAEVRKVDLTSTGVSTLVGNAWQALDVDGSGRQVVTYPAAIASDHAGTMYIVEPASHTVRAWNLASNAVKTLAGRAGFIGVVDGTGGAARFDYPVGACVDGGALYVADQNNFTVRKIVIATGAVTTIAGLGEEQGTADGVGAAARFGAPAGIACDGAGHVYVSDRIGFAIRRINLATAAVDTPVGMLGKSGYVDMPGAAARFTLPEAMAYAGGLLYVVDLQGTTVHLRKINVATWDVSTSSTSTRGGSGVAVDASGNVYLSDSTFGDAGIFKVGSGGSLTEIAGSSSTGIGLVIDGVGAAANFFDAAGMAYDGNALYVADPSGGVVRRVDLGNNMVTTPVGVTPDMPYTSGAGRSVALDKPLGLALANDSTLVVADASSLDSVALPGASVTVSAGKIGYGGGMDGVGSGASVWPAGVVSDGAGTIYFTGANTVRRYVVASGQVATLAGTEGMNGSMDGTKSAARFYWPQGIALDHAGGVLYVSDTQNHTIRKVVIATGEVTTLAGTAGRFGAVDGVGAAARFFYPRGLAYDGKGSLFVADSENGAIRRIDVATMAATTYAGVLGEKGLQPGPLPAHLNAPVGVAILPDGGLVVTDEQALFVVH